MTPAVVVGDIHGNFDALRAMLTRLETFDRLVIFVGDYVNGGPASSAVVEELWTKKREHGRSWLFLAGNHDLALLEYLRGGDFASFAAMGGVATISSYVDVVQDDVRNAFVSAFPQHHRRFLEELLPCYEDVDLLVSHIGFVADNPLERGLDALATKGNRMVFSSPTPRDLVVCGHYTQRSRKPFNGQHLICVDTGCGIADGPLTAVILPERTFLSATK